MSEMHDHEHDHTHTHPEPKMKRWAVTLRGSEDIEEVRAHSIGLTNGGDLLFVENGEPVVGYAARSWFSFAEIVPDDDDE